MILGRIARGIVRRRRLVLVFNGPAKKVSPRWVLEGDIKGCFDHISHQDIVLVDERFRWNGADSSRACSHERLQASFWRFFAIFFT
ncbi:hypothetical protein AALD01_12195 [Oscillospiraceae bacterium 21-37]